MSNPGADAKHVRLKNKTVDKAKKKASKKQNRRHPSSSVSSETSASSGQWENTYYGTKGKNISDPTIYNPTDQEVLTKLIEGARVFAKEHLPASNKQMTFSNAVSKALDRPVPDNISASDLAQQLIAARSSSVVFSLKEDLVNSEAKTIFEACMAKNFKPTYILDVGCGSGQISTALGVLFNIKDQHVVGYDVRDNVFKNLGPKFIFGGGLRDFFQMCVTLANGDAPFLVLLRHSLHHMKTESQKTVLDALKMLHNKKANVFLYVKEHVSTESSKFFSALIHWFYNIIEESKVVSFEDWWNYLPLHFISKFYIYKYITGEPRVGSATDLRGSCFVYAFLLQLGCNYRSFLEKEQAVAKFDKEKPSALSILFDNDWATLDANGPDCVPLNQKGLTKAQLSNQPIKEKPVLKNDPFPVFSFGVDDNSTKNSLPKKKNKGSVLNLFKNDKPRGLQSKKEIEPVRTPSNSEPEGDSSTEVSASSSSSFSDSSSESIDFSAVKLNYCRTVGQQKAVIPKALKMLAQKMGISENVDFKVREGNTHPFSAYFRHEAEKYVYSNIVTTLYQKEDLVVLDYFGSERTKKWSVTPLKIVNAAPRCSFPGDAARGERSDLPPFWHTFVIQEVYGDPFSPLEPLKTSTIKNVLEKSLHKVGYLILRKFEGMVGMDSPMYDEGMWVRLKEGILFSPAPHDQLYPPHPDPGYLFNTRSIDGISIASLKIFGPYHVLKVALEENLSLPSVPFPQVPNGLVVEVEIDDYNDGWFGSFKRFLGFSGVKTVWAVSSILYTKNYSFNTRICQGSTLDSLKQTVGAALASSVFGERLLVRFPREYGLVLDGTILAVFNFGRGQNVSTWSSIYKYWKRDDQTLLNMRLRKETETGVVEFVSSNANLMFKILGASTSLFFLYKTLSLGVNVFPSLFKTLKFFSRLTNASPAAASFLKFFPALRSFILKNLNLVESFVKTNVIMIARILDFLKYMSFLIFWAAFEEVIRHCTPRFGRFLLFYYETLSKFLMAYKLSMPGFIIGGCMSASLHNHLDNHNNDYSLKKKIFIHSFYNFMVTGGPFLIAAFLLGNLRFDQTAYHAGWQFIKSIPSIVMEANKQVVQQQTGTQSVASVLLSTANTFFPAVSSYLSIPPLRETVRDSLLIAIGGRKMELHEAYSYVKRYSDLFYKEKTGIYPVLLACVENSDFLENHVHPETFPEGLRPAMLKPSKSPCNLLTAIIQRLMKDPYHGQEMLDSQERLEKWIEAYDNFIRGYGPDYFVEKYTFEEAIYKMTGPKKTRLRRGMLELQMGETYTKAKSISVKHDETLALRPDTNQIKPRAITQLSPKYLAKWTQLNHDLADFLHHIFSLDNCVEINNPHLGKIWVCFVFASGSTQDALNALMAHSIIFPDVGVWASAGDDVLLYFGKWRDKLGVAYLEADGSNWDQTMGEETFLGDLNILRFWNVFDDFLTERNFFAEGQFVLFKEIGDEWLKLAFFADVQQATGAGDTTNSNSFHGLGLGSHLLANLRCVEDIVPLALELGIVLKTTVFPHCFGPTFLKGWWLPCVDGTGHWYPLPSMVLKLGKMLKPATEIFKKDPFEVAVKKAAYALATSPGVIPVDYPILGPFVHTLLRLGVETSVRLTERYEKVQCAPLLVPLDLDQVYQMIYQRYGVGEDLILSFHQLLGKVELLPACLDHPIFSLLLVDYT
jgi:SAM-dependent methyltransferase